jgi:hypothetical protein
MDYFEIEMKLTSMYGIQTPRGRKSKLSICKVKPKIDRRNFWREFKNPDFYFLKYSNGQ